MNRYHIAHIIGDTLLIERIHKIIKKHPLLDSEVVFPVKNTLSNKSILKVEGVKDGKWIDGLEVSAILLDGNLPKGCRITNISTEQEIDLLPLNQINFSEVKRKRISSHLRVIKSDSRCVIDINRVNDYCFLLREGNSMVA